MYKRIYEDVVREYGVAFVREYERTAMKLIRWSITLAYAAGIFYLSSRTWEGPPLFPFADKVIHIFLYTGLAYLCAWSLRVTSQNTQTSMAIWAIALATFYGVTDELHQLFVLGRSFELADILADAVGSCIGVLIAMQYAKMKLNTPLP